MARVRVVNFDSDLDEAARGLADELLCAGDPLPSHLAEAFSPYSDVPKELESDGWAFIGLIEVTNLHHRELIHNVEGKSVEETFSEILRDTTLNHAYLDKLKSIYTSPAYQDSIESYPLCEKNSRRRSSMPGSKSGAE